MTEKIHTIKNIQRVQISSKNKIYIEVDKDEGVAVDVDEKTIENLKDVFEFEEMKKND